MFCISNVPSTIYKHITDAAAVESTADSTDQKQRYPSTPTPPPIRQTNDMVAIRVGNDWFSMHLLIEPKGREEKGRNIPP